MKLLLDTLLLPWAAAEPRRLSRQARTLIELWCTDYKGELLPGIARLPCFPVI
jgi:hypothetical protein